MRESKEEQQLCPCYKEFEEFRKLMESQDSGLMIYCHRIRTQSIRQGVVVSTSRDVFILDNMKDVKMTSSEITSELEKRNISCPRCRKIFKHVQELVQKVKSINRKSVMGICDHCRKYAQTKRQLYCTCDDIVKKYKTVIGTPREDIKTNVKIWLAKMGHLLRDSISHNKPKQIIASAFSDVQTSKGQKSPASKHEPEIQQMFYSETHKSDLNLNTEISETDLKRGYITEAVTFTKPVETFLRRTPLESEKINKEIPSTSMADSDTTIVETYVDFNELPRSSQDRKQEDIFKKNIPSMDAKEALKRRHDFNLKHMLKHEKDSEVPYSVLKRPNVHEIPKFAPWEQKEEIMTQLNVESEMDTKMSKSTKRKQDIRPDYVLNRQVTYGSTRTTQNNVKEYSERDKADQYHHDKINQKLCDSAERQKEDEKWKVQTLKLQRNVTKFSHKTKEPHVIKSKSIAIETVGNVLKPQFSFFFPIEKEKKASEQTLDVTSSHIIKDTQEKFHLQAEIEKERQEEQRQRKLEQDQEKKFAREEKKLQAEEKRRLAVEEQYAEEQRKLTEDKKYSKKANNAEEKQEKPKRDKSKDGASEKDEEIISKSKLKGKLPKESEIATKESKSKSEHRNKIYEKLDVIKEGTKSKPAFEIDEDLQKAKKDLKSKSDQEDKVDEMLQKAKKDIKSATKQGDKIDEGLQKAKKDLKSKPDQEDKVDEMLQKAKKDIKSATKQGDKIDEGLQKATRDLKSKREQEDKTDEGLQKATKDLKSASEKGDKIDEVLQKAKKDLKSKPKEGDKTDKVLQKDKQDINPKSERKAKDVEGKSEPKEKRRKANEEDLLLKAIPTQKGKPKTIDKDEEKEKSGKDFKLATKQNDKMLDSKVKSEQKDTIMEKEQEIKIDKEEKDKKLQTEKEEREKRERNLEIEKENKERMKQLEQIRKEKEALKQQAIKDSQKVSKERDEPSKKEKSTKKKRDSSDEIKVSLTNIQKSMKKDKTDISEKKQEAVIKKKEKEENEPKRKPSKIKISKPDKETEEFKNLQAQHLKDKADALKKKKQQEYDAQVAKAKEEAARKAKQVELDMRDVKVQAIDSDLILRLVHIKQAFEMKACNISPQLIKEHICHHGSSGEDFCPLCLNSELELEVLSLDKKNQPKKAITDIIIGEKVYKNMRRIEKTKEPEGVATLYHKRFYAPPELPPKEIVSLIPLEDEPVKKQPKGAISVLSKKTADGVEVDPGKGILRYALSDRTFIEKGWTMLPTEKVVRKMNVYRMRPAHPEFDWFEHNKKKRLMTYDSGERLAEFDDNGRGRLYYKSGRLALDYYDAEEANAQQRFVIYSSGEPDERGRTHPITILATFDYLGNGIVFDHAGKIRLKYNQTEGVVLDRGIGPVSHWKWHTLNDPPVLQQVMIDTQMAHKDPNILKLGSSNENTTRPDNEEMLAIEFDNFIKEKSKKLSQKFKPFQIKMKALKINEHFSLKVLDQATVYLIFRDGSANVKFNIGMILDHQEIVDTDTAEVGEVSNSLERFPARTDSLAALQRSVAYAQRYERQHTERERRLRPPEPCASADQLTAAASRPMRPPFRTAPSVSSTSTAYCSRKPTNNLYYNTRLV